jgi:transposase-like protein
VADARRRTFSLDYKLRILKEAEAVKAIGGIGALLRREGLYSSHLTTWRQEREAGMRHALTPKSRGPKRKPDTQREELQQLRREILRLNDALGRAEMIIDVQKKVGSLLGWALPPGQEEKI